VAVLAALLTVASPAMGQERGAPVRQDVQTLLLRSDSLVADDPSSALTVATQALALAEGAGDPSARGRARYAIASALENLGRTAEAVAEYRQALIDLEAAGDSLELATAHSGLGLLYLGESRLDSAVVHHARAAELRIALGDSLAAGRSMNNLGVSHYQWGNYEQALQAYLRSLDLRRPLDRPELVVRVQNNVGKTYHDWGIHDRALGVFEEALKLAESTGDASSVAYTLHNLGMLRLDMGDLAEARGLFEGSLEAYRRSSAAVAGEALNITALALVDIREGHFERAIAPLRSVMDAALESGSPRREARALWYLGLAHRGAGNARAAEASLLEALDLSTGINQRVMANQVREELSSLYEARGDHRQALLFARAFETTRDSIFSQVAGQRIAAMEARAEVDRRAAENAVLREEQRVQAAILSRQRMIAALGGMLLVLALLWVATMIHANRAGRRKAALVAEANTALQVRNDELHAALQEVRTLQGLIPICSSCKKVRNDGGYWEQVESYVSNRSEAVFSHGMCPDCGPRIYGDIWTEREEESGVGEGR
jgi:tetratricopeptide (TPR) repeat protein